MYIYIYGLGGLGVAVACGVVVTHSPCVQHFLLSYSPKYLAPCRTVVYVLQCVCVCASDVSQCACVCVCVCGCVLVFGAHRL